MWNFYDEAHCICIGKVQEAGYRARIVDIANAFGLKGMIENRKDGRAKIIAEGEDEKLNGLSML